MKKLICLLMALLMFVCVFAGCGGGGDDGGEATLYWAMPFYMQDDTQKVTDAINEALAEKLPNTKIEFMLDSSMGEKWSLWMAGDKQIDIANIGMYVDLLTEVEKDSFTALDDLIKDYAPVAYWSAYFSFSLAKICIRRMPDIFSERNVLISVILFLVMRYAFLEK